MHRGPAFVAFDLGASSGRAVLGAFDGHRLTMTEKHRFANDPVESNGGLRWNVRGMFDELLTGLRVCGADAADIESVGIDTWGVDFALLDEKGELLEDPYHYRDPRTRGMIQQIEARIPRETIYARTGTQFMEINTLCQLYAANSGQAADLARARRLLFIPDLLNYWLTGEMRSEFTIASTSQMLDLNRRDWAVDLLEPLGLPTSILPRVAPPGSVVGPIRTALTSLPSLRAADVIAPASHDTASAIAAVPTRNRNWAYISCGTWSLVGVELEAPVLTPAALAANFTNEGGVGGTIRFLRNVTGLWLLQECRRAWATPAEQPSYGALVAQATASAPRLSFIDPDAPEFAPPGDMPARIQAYCAKTGQPIPQSRGAIVRCALESIALKQARVLRQIRALTQRGIDVLHIVGGGVRNELLCQLTADVTGLPVVAGPTEATVIGNLMIQALARRHVRTIDEIREVVGASFPLATYEPDRGADWSATIARFDALVGAPAVNDNVAG